MRLTRLFHAFAVTAMSAMGFFNELQRAGDSLSALAQTLRLTQPSKYKSKPNRVSQAKRRKYKRQGRV